MTCKDYILKYLSEHDDYLVESIDCSLCRAVGLVEYCRTNQGLSCEDTKKEWLAMERTPLNLKVGDIVEMEILPSITELRYYMGSELNLMYFCKTLEELEQAKKIGMVHYPNKGSLTLYDSRLLDRLPIRKVGEVND